MMKYIALLRGINVGGKNKVPMAELKQVFAALNFQNISTYINSGNVIFDTAATDILSLQQQCQAAILEHFQIEVPVAVISVTDLKAALAHGALHQKVNTTRSLLFHQLIQRQSSQKLVLLNLNMNVSLIMGRLSFGLRRLKPSQEQVGL